MEAPELERRLAAILAADVEGYSRLMHGDEEGTMAALSARRAVLDALVVGHRGRIANTAGDSVLAEFASVLDAVVCAIEIQRALAELNEAGAERTMRFRIGINVGDVMVKDGDIFGDGVNVASRLESLAEGGGICVSRGVRDHLRHRPSLVFEDLGEQLVKNIAHPIRAFRLRLNEGSAAVILEPARADDEAALKGELVSPDKEVALDLAFWESVKDKGPAELATYLERFPEGTFAALARTRQSSLENASADAAPVSADPNGGPDAAELSFWDSVKDSQRVAELAAYLDQYPDGHFAALARTRLSDAGTADQTPPSVGDPVELAFWEAIAQSQDNQLFEAYLQKYPNGEFAVIARARLSGGDG
jgi:class 3 adenylate cyclase